MGSIRFLLFLWIVIVFLGCKGPDDATEHSDVIGPDIVEDSPETIDLFVEGYQREPSLDEIQAVYGLDDMDGNDLEPKTRPPHYYECRMLENWAVGTDKTFFFEMPDQLSDDGFIFRFDSSGVIFWDYLSGYREVKIGSCTIGTTSGLSPTVLFLAWDYNSYNEVILDIRP